MASGCVVGMYLAPKGLKLRHIGIIKDACIPHRSSICRNTARISSKSRLRARDQGSPLFIHSNATKNQPTHTATSLPLSAETELPSSCFCSVCGRRALLPVFGGLLLQGGAHAISRDEDDYRSVLEAVHPARPDWYEEYFAIAMKDGMRSYEDKMAGYKRELFSQLDGTVDKILELGVGTGPNLKFYAGKAKTTVIGVDPNVHMEPYARASASAAGLGSSQFEFIHAVGEAIPQPESSVDAIVCTLVLCSVKDVDATLAEVQRVLKPGGTFFFIEHVAASDSSLRFWQNVLNPLQQLFADGCHLTRETLGNIERAGFASVDATRIMVPDLSIVAPHIVGTAQSPRL